MGLVARLDALFAVRKWLWWWALTALLATEVFIAFRAVGGDWLTSGDDMEHILPVLEAGSPADWLLGPWAGVRMFAYYRPVTSIAMWAELRIFGLEPSGWQALSLCLHACTTLMLAMLLHLVFRSPLAALIGASVWGLRAQLAEAVQWVPAQTDFLAGFFGVGCLLALMTWLLSPRWWKAVLAVAAGLLAMGSKEVALVLPLVGAVLALTAEAPGARRRRLLLAGTSIAVLGAFVVWRLWALGGMGFLPGQAVGESGVAGVRAEAVWRNLVRFLFPGPLGPFAFPNMAAALAAALTFLAAAISWRFGWAASAAVGTAGFALVTWLMDDPGYWLFLSTYMSLGLAVLVFWVAWLSVKTLPREALMTVLVGLALALPLYRVVYNKAGNVYYVPGIYWAMCWALAAKAFILRVDGRPSRWSAPTPANPCSRTPSEASPV